MDKVTPRKILEDDLFIKAFAEYIKLPEVTTDPWYWDGICA